EAHVSAWLEHAHIVPIYDYGTIEGISFIVMRLLTGGSLQDRIDYSLESGRDLPTNGEIIEVLRQLAGALDYAHNFDVIHRDIKPSNVMFDSVAAAFLVDFGVARMLEQSTGRLTRTGMAVGTAPYMAPEQFLNETPTAGVDQYAMGVMTFALLTGEVPYQASNLPALANMHVHEPIP
ncbi:MAG: serine/threonine protein kinase, partial [Anaerolineae bacterium]|nr:serine/threonine protein kinase [Anaerolineae bacterium]